MWTEGTLSISEIGSNDPNSFNPRYIIADVIYIFPRKFSIFPPQQLPVVPGVRCTSRFNTPQKARQLMNSQMKPNLSGYHFKSRPPRLAVIDCHLTDHAKRVHLQMCFYPGRNASRSRRRRRDGEDPSH